MMSTARRIYRFGEKTGTGVDSFSFQNHQRSEVGREDRPRRKIIFASCLNRADKTLEIGAHLRPLHMHEWKKMNHHFSKISIIIPTLNEEKNITHCLEATRGAKDVERIVVDGGSSDRTVAKALTWGASVLNSEPGRARQMNAGALTATGEILLFLHADTVLSSGFDDQIRRVLSRPKIVCGAFTFQMGNPTSFSLRLIQKAANVRSRWWQMPYGDQALFLTARQFKEIGGYPELPIMEDFELIRRLKKRGRIHTDSLPAITSARRWRALGIWRTTLLNYAIVLAYYAGVSPHRICRLARRKASSVNRGPGNKV
jgi:rSAM/selenodomain-associated transferase 2